MPDPFGSFSWICSHVNLPQCNLFFSQLFNHDPARLTRLFPNTSDFYEIYDVTSSTSRGDLNAQAALRAAGVGVAPNCTIPHVGQRGSIGDVALIVLSVVSLLFVGFLFWTSGRRRAAVGRIEFRILLVVYALHCAFQIVTMSSLLQQGTTALVVVSSIHIALTVAGYWLLLGNALIALQIVEDGTLAALVPLLFVALLFFAPVLYITLDTSLTWTDNFVLPSLAVQDLKSIPLFILTLVWPAVCGFLYWVFMMYIVLARLREIKPALLYTGTAACFVAAQVVFFMASQPLCEVSNQKVNASFLKTLLETAAVGVLYLAWKSITEDDWGDQAFDLY